MAICGGFFLIPAGCRRISQNPSRPPSRRLGPRDYGRPYGSGSTRRVGCRKTPVPQVWVAMVGVRLTPVMAWFAGLEPTWPACLAWAWALPFAGSWAGLGLAILLKRLPRW